MGEARYEVLYAECHGWPAADRCKHAGDACCACTTKPVEEISRKKAQELQKTSLVTFVPFCGYFPPRITSAADCCLLHYSGYCSSLSRHRTGRKNPALR